MLTPLPLAIIIAFANFSSLSVRNQEQDSLPCCSSADDFWNANEKANEEPVTTSLEKANDDQYQTYSPGKLVASSPTSIFQHPPSTFSRTTTLILKETPPTKHSIQRKVMKAVSGYVLGLTAAYYGMNAGVSLATYLELSLGATAALGVTLGVIAGAITIYYTWNCINAWFSN